MNILIFLASAGLVLATDLAALNSIEIKNGIYLAASLGLGGLAAWRRLGGAGLDLPSRRVRWALVAFLACLLASAALSPARALAWEGAVGWLLFALNIRSFREAFKAPGTLDKFFKSMLLLLLIASIWGLAQALGLDPSPWQDLGRNAFGRRVPACFGNPNFLAGFLVLALPLAALFKGPAPAWRWAARAGLVLGLVCLFLTGSKAAMVALGFQYFCWGHLVWHSGRERKDKLRFLRAWATAGALLLVLALAFLPPEIKQRAGDLLRLRGDSVTFRLNTWQASLRMVAERPLFGFGPNAWPLAYPGHRPDLAMQAAAQHSYEATRPENWILNIASELGLPALGLLCFLLFLILKPLWKESLASRGGEAAAIPLVLFLSLAGSLVLNLAGLDLFLPSSQWFFAAFIGIALARRQAAAVFPLRLGPLSRGLAGALLAALFAFSCLAAWQREQASVDLRTAENLCTAGRFSEAMPCYERSLSENALQPEALYFYASARLDRNQPGDMDAARALFARLQAWAPDYILVHDKLGRLLAAQNQPGPALSEWKRSIQLDPYYLPPYQSAAQTLYQAGMTAQATELLRQGLERVPGDPGLLNNQGVLLVQEGNLKEAEKIFSDLLDRSPDARYNLAVVLWKEGKTSQAREQVTRFLKDHPGHAGAQALKAKL